MIDEKSSDTTKTDDADKELLKTARKRFKASLDWWDDNRTEFSNDIEFIYVDQWPEYAKTAFGNDALITVNRQISFNRQVTNEMRQNRTSIKVRPVDDNADEETAEILQGLIRHIEANSNADIAYDTADRYAVEGGFGFTRIITDYKKDSFNQEIYIKPIYNPLSVVPEGKYSADGSDWDYLFIFDDVPREQFEGSDIANQAAGGWDIDGLAEGNWVTDNTVRICEYFYKERVEDELLQLEDSRILYKSEYDKQGFDTPITDRRKMKRDQVKWCKFVGDKIIERSDWAGSIIPVVPTYGDVVVVDGKHMTISLGRYAKDAQRMLNYSRTKQAELEALAPKAPYIMAAGQDEGYESDWENANNTNFSSLKYNPVTIDGQLAPPPQRQPYAGAPQGVIALGSMAEQDMMSVIGIHEAGLGQKSNETSGAAIMARQREGDNSTFNFVDNTTRSRRAIGKILVDLMPKIYDVPMVARILGEDGSQENVQINQPVVKMEEGREVIRIYDLSVGEYDVVCTAGASYTTKRAEGAAFLERVAGQNPQLMSMIGDLVFKIQDMPYADDIAERLQKTLPPELQDKEDGEEGAPELPMEVQQQMQQAQQMIQQLDQTIQQMQAELESKQAEQEAKAAELAIKQQQVAIDQFNAETKRAVDMFNAETNRMKAEADIAKQDLSDSDRAEYDAQVKVMMHERDQEHQQAMKDMECRHNQMMKDMMNKPEVGVIVTE